MTLGLIQSIEKPNNNAVNGDYIQSIFSSSLAIGALACLWKAITLRKVLRHKDLTQLGIALGYPVKRGHCPDKKCWEYLDINDIQQNTCYQNLDTKGLVKSIMRSFGTDEYTLLNIKIYSTIPAETINPYFGALDKKYTIKQENINRVNHEEESLLHMACRKDDLPLVKQLIELKADLNQDDFQGRTPVLVACRQQNLEVVNELLKQGADPDQADEEGRTPLQSACILKNPELGKVLLKYGADPNQSDHKGRTPLKFAGNNLKMVDVLQNHNASLKQAAHEEVTLFQSAGRNENPELSDLLTNCQNDLIAGIPSCENSKQKNNATQFTINLIKEVGAELKDVNKNPEIIGSRIGERIENNLEKLKKRNPTPNLIKWACNKILNLWGTIRAFIVEQLRKFRRKIESAWLFNPKTKTKETIAHLNETEEKITNLVHKELETLESSKR